MMQTIGYNEFKKTLQDYHTLSPTLPDVKEILEKVRVKGDDAIRNYTMQFDGINLKTLEVSKKEIEMAKRKTPKKVVLALEKAHKNIRSFALEQYKQIKNLRIENNGLIIGYKAIPIESVGCYVPGGRYPLPSSALMSIIPARIAGVKEIIVCSPKIHNATIVAANMAGADRIFRIGGAQAIAAMAYGTKTIPKVDKIVGPGNIYVTAAKKEVYGRVGIDFIAGPSEILIIADDSAKPSYVAADLLAQAEHDVEARVNLITTSKKLSILVKKELKRQVTTLKTKEIAEKSIKRGKIVLVKSMAEAVELSNLISPEHLELQINNLKPIISKLTNYGSLFIGEMSAEVFGDYCSGPNHILPTGQASRYTGGLSVKDFMRLLTYQQVSSSKSKSLVETASILAEAEGLLAHKNAADIRKTK